MSLRGAAIYIEVFRGGKINADEGPEVVVLVGKRFPVLSNLGRRYNEKCLRLYPGPRPIAVEHIKVHGTSLKGNLEGDSVNHDVIVFLPPSYSKETPRRYRVVYALHGYSIGAEQSDTRDPCAADD